LIRIINKEFEEESEVELEKEFEADYEKDYDEESDIIYPIETKLREDGKTLPYIKIETDNRLCCDLFSDIFHFNHSKQYYFKSDQAMNVSFEKLENILRTFFTFFDGNISVWKNPSFLINQTCNKKEVNYSWFGYGPDNFLKALEEQKIRYEDAKLLRPHHREVACFLARCSDFFFYMAFQPDTTYQHNAITFDYLEAGFILDGFPFNTGRFVDFYKEVGLKEPDFIKEGYKTEEIKLTSEGLTLNPIGRVVYKSGYIWTSKIIIENPFYGNKKYSEYISQHKKLVVDLTNHHTRHNSTNYRLNKLVTMHIPYGNFGFSAIKVMGDW
jgi:hypothetical protein